MMSDHSTGMLKILERLLVWLVVVAWAVSLATGLASPVLAQSDFPYDLQTGRELAITGTGAMFWGVGLTLDTRRPPLTTDEIARLDPSDVNRCDRSATTRWSPGADTASDILAYSSMAAPAALLLTDHGSREPWTLTLMYAETLLLNSGMVFFLKSLVSRTRPYAYNDDPRIPLEEKYTRFARRSFPSGHTANAFTAATFLSVVHQRLYPGSSANAWVWAGSLTVASATGILRYAAGKHFPSDILVGAAIGTLTGWLVPELHEVDPTRAEDTPAGMPAFTISFAF